MIDKVSRRFYRTV